MDKLRAIQYFVAAADAGSFSGAARQMDVSTNAIAKLVSALERSLGARLFDRHSSGLVLTAPGAAYLDTCQGVLAQLEEADERAGSGATRPHGSIVVGAQHVIAQEALAPALPRFNQLYPDIQIDLRHVLRITDAEVSGIDVMLVLGWPKSADLVRRTIGAAGFEICAAPSYWAAHGVPEHPSELARHNCLTIRGNVGTVLDLWHFKRGDEEVSVPINGWLLADNLHRDVVISLAVAGAGVVRVLDWANRNELASGALVPVLTAWDAGDVPPVTLLYRPNARRPPRVRLFIEFVTQLFLDIENRRKQRLVASEPPRWTKRPYVRASTILHKR